MLPSVLPPPIRGEHRLKTASLVSVVASGAVIVVVLQEALLVGVVGVEYRVVLQESVG